MAAPEKKTGPRVDWLTVLLLLLAAVGFGLLVIVHDVEWAQYFVLLAILVAVLRGQRE